MDAQSDWSALPGQVAKVALVAAVNAVGQCAAVGAGGCGSARLRNDDDAIKGGQDLHDGQARRGQGQQTLGQGGLSTQEGCSPHLLTQPRNGHRLHGKCGRNAPRIVRTTWKRK